jgi:DNA-binding LacI/PurR family transcriptional regulator
MAPDGRVVTIKEVARAAGVAISTVSRALNDSGPVHPETREKIVRIATELGFRPNTVAQSMVTHSTGILGLLIPDLRNPYFPALGRGVEDEAAKRGYTVMLGNSDNDPNREWKFVRTLIDKQVDGIVLVSTAVDVALVQRIADAGIPVSSLDPSHAAWGDVVRADQVEAARTATLHLIRLGHRRVAHIAAPSWTRTGRDRMQGYRMAMTEAGLPLASSLIHVGDWLPASGGLAAREIMAHLSPPTAIYAANDLMAIGAIVWLTKAGYRVPEDVAVVGHGNIPFSELVAPPLTSVAESEYQIGSTLAAMIFERIDRQYSGPPRLLTLPFHLVIRDTCGPARQGEGFRGQPRPAKADHS